MPMITSIPEEKILDQQMIDAAKAAYQGEITILPPGVCADSGSVENPATETSQSGASAKQRREFLDRVAAHKDTIGEYHDMRWPVGKIVKTLKLSPAVVKTALIETGRDPMANYGVRDSDLKL